MNLRNEVVLKLTGKWTYFDVGLVDFLAKRFDVLVVFGIVQNNETQETGRHVCRDGPFVESIYAAEEHVGLFGGQPVVYKVQRGMSNELVEVRVLFLLNKQPDQSQLNHWTSIR